MAPLYFKVVFLSLSIVFHETDSLTKMPPSSIWSVPANATQEALAPINIGWQVLGPATMFCSLALLMVLARWYTKIFIVRKTGPEDLLISLAMVCSTKYLHNLDLILIEKKFLMIAHTITTGFRMSHLNEFVGYTNNFLDYKYSSQIKAKGFNGDNQEKRRIIKV